MLVAALGFAIMGALVKIGAQKFSAAELVFYRSVFGLATIWLYIAIAKLPLRTPHVSKHMSRSLVGFTSLVLFFYAIAHLPLATAITLNYTSPLFLAVFMPFLLHEKPKKILLIALAIGFIGVTLLLKPTFDKDSWFAGLMGLISGMGAAVAYVNVKQLGQLNEPDWRTVFYFTLLSTIGAGLWMLFDSFQQLAWNDLAVLGGLGLSATIAQLALTRAYRTGDTLVVASLAYVTVLLASVFGIILWGEHLSLDAWLAIGLIIISGVISVHSSPAKTP
ncbi:MAG: EamA family transporter [Methylotenera sp. 24-45-7]|jgi:drug/metabolite transporter (DMT)-like permease|nr:MAG: EamA family transporter [Methylotenera sp. 24-45-7]OZA09725.1 MAG: EamA family transporter [Methylotenera sp. 17-45-7]OZA54512.1 MAG: EamA family transporter [Methylophilales bacterium 39-45-7]